MQAGVSRILRELDDHLPQKEAHCHPEARPHTHALREQMSQEKLNFSPQSPITPRGDHGLGVRMIKTQEIIFKALRIDVYMDARTALYQFQGDVDEAFEHKRVPVAARPTIRFDLGGIASINSCGVREWCNLMTRFSQGAWLTLENCSVAIVDQFNIVPQTIGRAFIQSFYAPYYCSSCDEETTVLLDTETHQERLRTKQAPEICHHCGTTLEFDALEESYFQQIDRFFAQKAS